MTPKGHTEVASAHVLDPKNHVNGNSAKKLTRSYRGGENSDTRARAGGAGPRTVRSSFRGRGRGGNRSSMDDGKGERGLV
jgi:hypothetical protein